MVQKRDNGGSDALMVLGGAFGGTFLAELLARKPSQTAPDTERLNYIADLIQELIRQDGLITQRIQDVIDALAGLAPGVLPSSILTPWVAGDPDLIFEQAIRNAGTFFTTKRVDFRRGKRLIMRAENTLDQAVILQTIGNFQDTEVGATDIGLAVPGPANTNTSIGLAWDDWHPYIALRMTIAVAPANGFLRIYSVTQE
jgi:hypothetical protein